MVYQDFRLETLRKKFGINNISEEIFDKKSIQPIVPSDWLKKTLAISKTIPLKSEKAKSEMRLAPILMELKDINKGYFNIYSGDLFNVDKDKGLNGECDFLLAYNTKSVTINTPIISVVEAKKNDLEIGYGQCGAQMYGAMLFNQLYKSPIPKIFGCVTTTNSWQFLKLEDKLLTIDSELYFFSELEIILGVFQKIIDYYRTIIK